VFFTVPYKKMSIEVITVTSEQAEKILNYEESHFFDLKSKDIQFQHWLMQMEENYLLVSVNTQKEK
jgi:hypothetical protein